MPILKKLKILGASDDFHPKQCSYFEWPKIEDIKQMIPKDANKEMDGLYLKSITVRADDLNFITGIKVELANGFSSPYFRETD